MAETSRIELDTSDMQRIARAFQRAPQLTGHELRTTLSEILLLLEREVKDATPTGVGGGAGLRGSITHALMGTQAGHIVSGRVFSPLNYALPVELGSKPHWVPLQPLADWAVVKLGVPRAEAHSVAFLISRKISRKGTKGAHMFEDTLSKQSSWIVERIGQAIDRIYSHLDEGA